MLKKYIRSLCCILLIFLFTLNLCSCSGKQTEKYSKSGTYFDTVISITLYDKNKASLIDDCFEMADHYEKLFSRTVPDSDVSRINDAKGDFVTVDDETLELINYGLHYCEISEGKFDITIGALSDLWDITENPGVIPEEEKIQEALGTIGYENIQIQGNQAALTQAGAKLDLGGIAKGYIADKMKAYLQNNGVTSGMINLGGNVLVIGNKPDGSKYNVAIQKPFDEMNSAIAAVQITDQTVVSSGIYERYFELDGRIYHHILDTSTGYPVENNLLGVTIICDNSVDGDGLSTTCLVLGLDKGMALIENLDNTEAVFITDDYELHCSSGIGENITISK